MIGLLLYYRINACISVALASIVFYLILIKSPLRMKNFKWHLLNIHCITFAETFYWCYLSAPQILAYPFPHGYSTGVLTSLIPYNIQGGIAIFLLGETFGALCIGFIFRYSMLMPRSDIFWIQSFIQKMPILAAFISYASGFLYGFLTYMAFLGKEETEQKLHQIDPLYVISEESITIGGVWVYPWAGLAFFGNTFAITIGVTIVAHSKRILKAQRSRTFHQEAFRSLVLQVAFLYGTIAIPCAIVPVYMILQPKEYIPYMNEAILSFCTGFYTLKSIFASFLICYTIRPYREYVIGFFRLSARRNDVIAVSVG